jgi:tRNA nucleotidyltransferase (CCA-adding enzyme)
VLEGAGHEVWCVGGAVRDALLGEAHLDWDLATSATPAEVRRLFRRTVPLGIEFGTVGVLDDAGRMHEVTTFRRDVRTDGRHAVVEFGVSLEDDLARRDFTINAIAVSPDGRRLADPFDGQGDLARGVVRAVGDPDRRVREDRLRALRGLRFAARFGFVIDPATWQAIEGSAADLTRLSAERVKQEIEKTLEQVARPSRAFTWWRDAGAFGVLVPALSTVSDAALAAIDRVPRAPRGATAARADRRRIQRLAILFASVGARAARQQLKALRFSNADQTVVGRLLDGIDRHGPALGAAAAALAGAARSGEALASTERLARGVAATVGRVDAAEIVRLGAAVDPQPAAGWRSLHRIVTRVAQRDPVSIADLALDGDDLRMLGIVGAPAGAALRVLLEAVLDAPALNTRDGLTTLLRARGLVPAATHASP